jgi:hypothetical protein
MEGIMAGVQYASIDTTGALNAADDSSAFAGKVGYANGDMGLKVSAAYSQTDTKGKLDISNVATGHTMGSQSKLYTEAWWNYGYVGAYDNSAINVTAEYAVKDIVDLGVYYTMVDFGDKSKAGTGMDRDMTELTVTASRSFGPLDASLVYINADAKDQNAGDAYNTVQAYLTVNF